MPRERVEWVGAERPSVPTNVPLGHDAASSPASRLAVMSSVQTFADALSLSRQLDMRDRDTCSFIEPVPSRLYSVSSSSSSSVSEASRRPSCASLAFTSQIFALRKQCLEANERLDELHKQQEPTRVESARRFEELQKQHELRCRESDRRFEQLLLASRQVGFLTTEQHQSYKTIPVPASAALDGLRTKGFNEIDLSRNEFAESKIDVSQNFQLKQSPITGHLLEFCIGGDDDDIPVEDDFRQGDLSIQLLYDSCWQFDSCLRLGASIDELSSSGAVQNDGAFQDYCISVKNTFLHFDTARGGFLSARPRSCPVLLGAEDTDHVADSSLSSQVQSGFALSSEHGDVHAEDVLYSKEHGDVHAFEGQALTDVGSSQVLSEFAFSSEHGDVHAEDTLYSKEHGDVHAFGGQALIDVGEIRDGLFVGATSHVPVIPLQDQDTGKELAVLDADDHMKTQVTKAHRKHKRKRDYAWKRREPSLVSK